MVSNSLRERILGASAHSKARGEKCSIVFWFIAVLPPVIFSKCDEKEICSAIWRGTLCKSRKHPNRWKVLNNRRKVILRAVA